MYKRQVLKASGASGVICKGDGVQVVYGPKVAVIGGGHGLSYPLQRTAKIGVQYQF